MNERNMIKITNILKNQITEEKCEFNSNVERTKSEEGGNDWKSIDMFINVSKIYSGLIQQRNYEEFVVQARVNSILQS